MLEKIYEKLSWILQVCMAVMIGALLALNLTQVVTRYFIKYTIVWLNDLNIFFLLWLTCIALPWLWLRRKHLMMDYADKIIPKPAMRVLEHVIAFMAMGVSVGLMVSASMAVKSNTGFVATTLGWDEGVRYVTFIVCGGLWLVCAIIDELRRIRDAKLAKEGTGR